VWPVAPGLRANVVKWALPGLPANRARQARRVWPARRVNAALRAPLAISVRLVRPVLLVLLVPLVLRARQSLAPNRFRRRVIPRES